jgi:hypothetical protein
MAYAIGTDKREGTVQPSKASSGIAAAATRVGSSAASTPMTRTTPAPPKQPETAAVVRAQNVGKAVADTSTDDWNKSATLNTSATAAKPGFTAPTEGGTRTEQRVTRPAGGLNSDKFYQRVADNGGVVPFEGPVDWGGIYDYLQAPANRRLAAQEPANITVRGGNTLYDKVDPETGLSFGMMLDFLNTPEVASSYLAPVASGPELWPPGGPNAGKQMPPLIRTGTSADTSITRAYGPDGVSAPLEAIDAIEVPDIQYPQIAQSADAGDLFETDGRAVTPDGVVLNPGGPAVAVPVSTGIDAAAPAKEPSTWDNVVDNTGKLLSHSGLGAIVSTLFPDLWSSGGDMMKGLFDGERGTATANGDFTRWDPREGVSMGGGSSFSRDASGYVDTTPNAVPGKGEPPVVPPVDTFPDLNHNGIDDRTEDYTGPDTKVVFDLPPTRKVRFPDIPPYDPGRSDEWKYFTHNHLAEGGIVEAYAEGGAIDPSDPKVKLIGDTEDVLEDIKSGKKPDEAAAATLKAFVAQFGDAALKSLHENVTGGMTMKSGRQIKGPGGPKDDAVPAVIVEEGSVVSPAKLSNGEFVFSVDAVKGIGEGDIEVGAQRLQQLAERLSAGKGGA